MLPARITVFSFLIGACILFFVGCGKLPPIKTNHPHKIPTLTQKSSTTLKREKLATELSAKGAYPEALVRWKILSTLFPKNILYQQKINQTLQLIKTNAKKHLQLATTAFEIGDTQLAQLELLKSLAFDPDQKAALSFLKDIESKTIELYQTAKYERIKKKRLQTRLANQGQFTQQKTSPTSDQEFYYLEQGIRLYQNKDFFSSVIEFTKFLNAYPGDPLAQQYLSDAHMGAALSYIQSNQLHEALESLELARTLSEDTALKAEPYILKTRKLLADIYYQKGQRIFRKNTDMAIEYWQKSLEYNPRHTSANMHLHTALRIKNNLDKLESVK